MLHAQNNYLTTRVQTSSPGELTLMLYNGCIKFIKLGVLSLEKRDMVGKHNNFMRAQNIIDELQATLNMEYEISNNLFSLYSFIQEKLSDANIKCDNTAAEYCINLLSELRDTWEEALKSLKVSGKVHS